MAKHPPKWHEENLVSHYELHPKGDCRQHWNDVLGFTPEETISIDRYEDESRKIVRDAWYVFDAQEWDYRNKWYKDSCIYYIDDRLLRAITIYDRERGDFFKTCYDYHFAKDGSKKGHYYCMKDRRSLGGELRDTYRKEVSSLVDASISPHDENKRIKAGSFREIPNGNK